MCYERVYTYIFTHTRTIIFNIIENQYERKAEKYNERKFFFFSFMVFVLCGWGSGSHWPDFGCIFLCVFTFLLLSVFPHFPPLNLGYRFLALRVGRTILGCIVKEIGYMKRRMVWCVCVHGVIGSGVHTYFDIITGGNINII